MGLLDARKTPNDGEPYGQMAGEYKILRKLGTGGFGSVYEAEHPVLKRKAAVKVLHQNRAVDSAAVRRFIAEAQSANQIRHRHIVDIFSFGTLKGGQHFYVMDMLDGAPLDRYLDEKKRLPPEIALPLLGPIADALDALHAAGIIHRDVKPANIFLAWESSGEVVPKLLDFGLVKLLADSPVQTASGVPMGTPYYMSPEQCRGEKIDARADVYAFGVICHELLTGAPPFTGDSPSAVLVAHLVRPPPRMSESSPDLPPELDAPVLEMLAKDADARPSSVGAAVKRLTDVAKSAGLEIPNGLPRLPRPSTPPEADGSAFGERSTARPTGVRRGVSGDRDAANGRWGRLGLVWGSGILLVVIGAASLSLLGRGARPEPAASASASSPAAGVESQSPLPPSGVPAPSGVSAAMPNETIPLTLSGVPDGTAVMLGDRKLGEAPGAVPVPRGTSWLELSLVAPGYDPQTIRVLPSAALEVPASLVKSRRAAKRPATPRDLENPF